MAKGRVKRHRNGYADPRQFRGGSGQFASMAIFLESNQTEGFQPFYTLKEFDDEERNLPSAYKIFMDAVDEYDAGMKLVGSSRFWNKLSSASWFLCPPSSMCNLSSFEGLIRWREDKRAKQRSRAMGLLIEAADEGNMIAVKKIFDESKEDSKRPVDNHANEKKDRNKRAAKILEMHKNIKSV